MRKTAIRKLAIGSCMALTLLSGLAVTNAAFAQRNLTPTDPTSGIGSGSITLPGNVTTNADILGSPATLGAGVADMMGRGMTPADAAQILSAAGVNISGASPQELLSLLQNVQNLTQQQAAALLTNVISGALPADIATAVSGLQNFGNITNASGLISALQGSGSGGVLSALQSMNPNQQAQALNAIMQSAGLTNMTGTEINQLGSYLDSAFPGLGDMLGGANGISDLLRSGGLGGALGVSGGTPCCQVCRIKIPEHHNQIQREIDSEFQLQQGWLISDFWTQNVLPALMLMAEQLTATGIAQVQMFGMMLDAKHQLETQRVFQTMAAQAHKDYQPSEGMCTFGTTVRSLAASERKSNLAQISFSDRMMQRQTHHGSNLTSQGEDSDLLARLDLFKSTFCDPADNQNGLTNLCQGAVSTSGDKSRRNADVDYTRTIESRLTLNTDFLPQNAGDTNGAEAHADEQDVFALSSNLFANDVGTLEVPIGDMVNSGDKRIYLDRVGRYMDLRSVFAKRSVAQNSFSAIAALRAAGSPESAPYTKAILRELGVADDKEINKILGDNPSQFAQMEVLTKMIPQSPSFYVELIDKPANVDRKGAALQAIALMQDRDLFDSLLRSEAVLSVLLETMLVKEQDKLEARGSVPAAKSGSGGGKE